MASLLHLKEGEVGFLSLRQAKLTESTCEICKKYSLSRVDETVMNSASASSFLARCSAMAMAEAACGGRLQRARP